VKGGGSSALSTGLIAGAAVGGLLLAALAGTILVTLASRAGKNDPMPLGGSMDSSAAGGSINPMYQGHTETTSALYQPLTA